MSNQVNPLEQNMINRQRLLTTGIQMVKRLAPIECPQNTVTKVPLLRMGIMTGVLLQFTVDITVASGTGDSVKLSEVGPWNAIRRIAYNDFAGVKRTNTSGIQLWLAQNFKMGDVQGGIPTHHRILGAGSTSAEYDLFASTNTVLNATGSISAAGVVTEGNSARFTFSLYVPMAYDPASDLTGAVLTQTNVGEHYIELDIGNLVGPDLWANMLQPTSDATLSSSKITVEAFQHYIQPQSMSADQLPLIDLSMIYGFEGAYETSANIETNSDVYINYPNNRSVLSALVNYQNGNTFDKTGSDVNGIVLMANSNTNFREMSARYMKEQMRNIGNFDAPGGSYFLPHRRQPILTQLYGNAQLKFSMGTVINAAPTKLISQFEVQYQSGAPLPGVTIAA